MTMAKKKMEIRPQLNAAKRRHALNHYIATRITTVYHYKRKPCLD